MHNNFRFIEKLQAWYMEFTQALYPFPFILTLSPCLFNLYAEYIMRNTGLEEAQTGIKIVGRNLDTYIRYLRYVDVPCTSNT